MALGLGHLGGLAIRGIGSDVDRGKGLDAGDQQALKGWVRDMGDDVYGSLLEAGVLGRGTRGWRDR